VDENLSSKRYEPVVIDLENKNSSHTITIGNTGFNKTVLEIGTSTGYISKILKEHGNKVTGIEIDREAGAQAQQYCDRMIIGDVETQDLDEILTPASFDIIICEDVLEHLKKPATTLKKIQKFLKPDGYLIVSLPNFCHGDVLLNIINGDFHYTSMGLLDETHLHFFGLKNIYSVFADCGYQIKDLKTTNLNVGTTELRMNETTIPRDLLKFIKSLPESTVYQYVFRAYPSDTIIIPPPLKETDVFRLFSDSLRESRQELQAPWESKFNSLDKTLAVKDQQLLDVSTQVININKTLETKDQQLKEVSNQVINLNQTLAVKDQQLTEISTQVTTLNQSLAAKDQQLTEVSNQVINLNQTLAVKDQQLTEISTHVTNLDQSLAAKDQELSQIKNSIIWQFVMKFHYKVIERLLPHNTTRRKYYNLGLKGGKLLVNDGWDSFWWKYQERRSQTSRQWEKRVVFPKYNNISSLDSPEDDEKILDTRVSIVIPTKNAGPDFESALMKIRNQKRLKNIEIIIVDSGSTDNTTGIAKEYECNVFPIKPEDFNHGLTRNYGAEQATGDYIVFMVQDAIPIGDYWLYNMLKSFIGDQKIAAVTCRQVPRSDADLFAGFLLWHHYRSLKRTQDIIYPPVENFNALFPIEKRIFAGIEDTCCMMQKKIFDQVKFRNIQYGEDLDIGIRFLEAGNTVAFLFSTGVIHSHNRDAAYFFKRSFIDTLMLDSLLCTSQRPVDTNISLKVHIEQILGLYSRINDWSLKTGKKPTSIIQIIDHLKKVLQSTEIYTEDSIVFSNTGRLVSRNPANTLAGLLADCAESVNVQSFVIETSMINSYCTLLDDFSEYCSAYSSIEERETEIYESFEKLFALIAGSTLASYFYKKSETKLSDSELALMKMLGEGI
jgi:glycosyltransferase involved in cell wall biosynthesis/2-polyprenyl-3-methyl-5-hydroxy-6-metoxy-1,4-benzoquinol methylase